MEEKRKWESKLSDGPAEYRLVNLDEGVSKAGNQMLIVDFQMTQGVVTERLRQWFVFNYPKKLEHLCIASNNETVYLNKIFTAETMLGMEGNCELEFDSAFGAFKVKKWVFPKKKKQNYSEEMADISFPVEPKKSNVPVYNDFDDDIPF